MKKHIRTRAYRRSHVFHYMMDPMRPEYLVPRCHGTGDVIWQILFWPNPETEITTSGPIFADEGQLRVYLKRLAWEYGDDPDLQVAGVQREVMDTKGRFLYDPSFDGSDFIRIYEEAQNKRSYTTTGSARATE